MTPLTAQRHIAAPADVLYDLVSDVTRMAEWSPENQGGQWLNGATGPKVGARFKAKNKRKMSWTTTSVVTEAEPGRAFAFAVGRHAPERPDTRWRYSFEPAGDGSDVTETCEVLMNPGAVGRFLTKLGTGLSWDERPADLVKGMQTTLERLAAAAESKPAPPG